MVRPEIVAVTKKVPTTIGELVDWMDTATKLRSEIPTGEEIAFIDAAYMDHVNRIAGEQGVPVGWLGNGVAVLLTERLRTGKQLEFDLNG